MDTEKIVNARRKIQILLNAQDELIDLQGELGVDDIIRHIDTLIIETAAQMDIVYQVKKSEMPCNCCNEEIDAQQKLMQVVEAVDNFITAINKLANQKKF